MEADVESVESEIMHHFVAQRQLKRTKKQLASSLTFIIFLCFFYSDLNQTKFARFAELFLPIRFLHLTSKPVLQN